jgi:TrmH family RNA methyltransferase
MKLLDDAVRSGADITTVLTASKSLIPLPVDTRVYYAERSLIDSLSPLKSSQDTLFICERQAESNLTDMSGAHILLDGVQDPGNVGTIIRTANAFGMKSVILTGDCADLYNPKTIRATMGAVFRQRVHYMGIQELAELCERGVRFIGAVPDSGSLEVSQADLRNAVIAIGNEGSGLSVEVLSLCSLNVMIPVEQECDSLNAAVAAAIMMWNARS